MKLTEEDDLPENKQAAVWFTGLITASYVSSLFGIIGFITTILVTTSISLVILKQKNKPAVAGTTTSQNEQELRQNPCSQYSRK